MSQQDSSLLAETHWEWELKKEVSASGIFTPSEMATLYPERRSEEATRFFGYASENDFFEYVKMLRLDWRKRVCSNFSMLYPDPPWFIGKDEHIHPLLHLLRYQPTQTAVSRDLVFVFGGGYTDSLCLSPTLFASAFTQRGYLCFGIEFAGYGRTQGRFTPSTITIRSQVTAWLKSVSLIREQVPKSVKMVGVAWGMGALSLFQAIESFDAIVGVNSLLNTELANKCILEDASNYEAVLHCVPSLFQNAQGSSEGMLDRGTCMPSYETFRDHVLSLEPSKFYPCFEGYLLDQQSFQQRDLLAQYGWKELDVHGQFFQELLFQDVSSLPASKVPKLLLHGSHNKLHDVRHVQTVCTHLSNCTLQVLEEQGHNNFMHVDHPFFPKVVDRVLQFVQRATTLNTSPLLEINQLGARKIRISVAQMDCLCGEVEANIQRIVGFVHEAKALGSNIVVFPELALTGYSVHAGFHKVAVRFDSDYMQQLLALTLDTDVDLVMGLIEETPSHLFYNSAVYLSRGCIVHNHRKVYLPNYGRFQEKRWYGLVP